eukprot:g21476.t1
MPRMDVDVTPLKRSWCLFEMLHTFRQRDHTQERPIAFQGLLMLTPQGEIADKEKIDAEVRAQEGGFPAINAKLRSEICQVLEQMASTFTEDLSELARQLRERELSPRLEQLSRARVEHVGGCFSIEGIAIDPDKPPPT